MSSRRALKAAQAIREVVSSAILLQLKDPRVTDVTVTLVEVSGDLRTAKVYVSVMGDETKQELCLKGLRSSTGFLQKKVGNRIDTRYIPRLSFVLDKGAQNALEVTRILNEVLPAERNEVDSEDLDGDVAAPRVANEIAADPSSEMQEDSQADSSNETTSESQWPATPPGLKAESPAQTKPET